MKFSDKIEQWYETHRRNLPWRQTDDPYSIWIAEVIFQQTRINQGLAYYERFMEQFPTVKHLADADEKEVLKRWQGLGYYSRARNLHHTARVIIQEHGGAFPETYEKLIQLKGIGEYTAAAILSIAFQKPFPVVDGNVSRVLARVFGIRDEINSSKGKKIFYAKARQLMGNCDPGTFNQALMEFGALYCVPSNPDCPNCLFADACFAYKNKLVEELPVKKPKKATRKRFFHYLVIQDNRGEEPAVFMKKRTGNDIWRHLYEFPLIETNRVVGKKYLEKLFSDHFDREISLKRLSPVEYKHVLTHQTILCRFYRINVENTEKFNEEYIRIPLSEVRRYPVSRLVEKYLEEHLL